MYQEAPAIRGRRNIFNVDTINALAGTTVCERQAQGSVDLPAKLSSLPLCLSFR
jgi:hypothetical protein